MKIEVKKFIPGIILGFLVLLGLTLFGDIQEIRQTMGRFKWSIFPVVLLFTLFNYSLRFIKWNYYLKLIGVSNLSWKESLRIFLAGFPLAVTPGKIGEVLKGVWVNKRWGIPVGRAVSVVVAERISDGLAVLGLSVLGVIAYPKYWPGFVIVLCLLLAVVIMSQIRPLAMAVLEFGEKIPLMRKFTASLREFYEGSFYLFKPLSTVIGVGLGVISWFGEGIGFYLILVGLGLPATFKTLSVAVFVLSFSTIIGAISALPGGLGAAELTIAGMLAFIAGLEPAVASSATVLIRLATLWFGVGLGLIVWTVSPDLLGLKGNHESIR